jgi:hypothetical protein
MEMGDLELIHGWRLVLWKVSIVVSSLVSSFYLKTEAGFEKVLVVKLEIMVNSVLIATKYRLQNPLKLTFFAALSTLTSFVR